ncbi:hypothetical protein EIP86_005585 [Pleurotus ostreatoroseus]|nr:hypothetical protein EIP86_005585 [Pleurotus ostreatoroseus]
MDLRGGDQYDIAMHVEGTLKTYRTLELLSDSKTVNLLGRGTRVWKVVQIEAGKEFGEPMVLKDTWSDPERCTEGQLLEKVRAAERPDNLKPWLDKLFPTIICHGDVSLDEEPRILDCTRSFGPDASIDPILCREDICRGEDGYGPWDAKYTPCRQRVHYRLVIGEVCKPLEKETSLSAIYRALGDAAIALQVMHSAGWVHRDVSAGNILLKEDGSILLSDLELAKEMCPQDEFELVRKSLLYRCVCLLTPRVRQGTPGFISVEVHDQEFLFLPINDTSSKKSPSPKYTLHQMIFGRGGPNAQPPSKSRIQPAGEDSLDPPHKPVFLYNPLHDLESLWWLAIYFAVKKEILDGESPEEASIVSDTHRSYASKLFTDHGLRYRTMTMPSLLLNHAEDRLPYIACNLVAVLEDLLQTLRKKYCEVEKNTQDLDHRCADGLHETFQQFFHKVADAELVQDLTIRPFTPLPARNDDWFFAGARRGPSSSLSSGSSAKRSRSNSGAEDSDRSKRARSEETIVPDTAPARRPYLPRRAKEQNVRR